MIKNAKKLAPFQQQELDAAVMYKALANKMKSKKDKLLLEELAACEGKHAAMLKQITNRSLKPHTALKSLVLCSYTIIGKKFLFFAMSKFESSAFNMYKPFFTAFPVTVEIAEDEVHHAKLLQNAIK